MSLGKEFLTEREIQEIHKRTAVAISPLESADESAPYFYGMRTLAGQKLPPYYLVYFLLVDLLGFRHGGPQEKVAWSIPVEIDGSVAMIEHRKLGLGVFEPHEAGQSHSLGPALPKNEAIATQIVQSIEKGIKAATPFFNHLASVAVSGSHLNVVNNSGWLYERYEYLRDEFRKSSKRQLTERMKSIPKNTKTQMELHDTANVVRATRANDSFM